jgi:hypothetical protein
MVIKEGEPEKKVKLTALDGLLLDADESLSSMSRSRRAFETFGRCPSTVFKNPEAAAPGACSSTIPCPAAGLPSIKNKPPLVKNPT